MGFYDLSKSERNFLVAQINQEITSDLSQGSTKLIITYFSDKDTYIRKTGYLATGKLFYAQPQFQNTIFSVLKTLMQSEDELIRQTSVNAAGEVGRFHFDKAQYFMDTGLFDHHHHHHHVRNAVIGSVKKMGEKNPEPVLAWSKTYLKHSNKEIRREICHGIELRGQTHLQDVLPLLKALEFDEIRRVFDTLIHVVGQIAYNKGCLKTVVAHLNT